MEGNEVARPGSFRLIQQPFRVQLSNHLTCLELPKAQGKDFCGQISSPEIWVGLKSRQSCNAGTWETTLCSRWCSLRLETPSLSSWWLTKKVSALIIPDVNLDFWCNAHLYLVLYEDKALSKKVKLVENNLNHNSGTLSLRLRGKSEL